MCAYAMECDVAVPLELAPQLETVEHHESTNNIIMDT